MYPPDVEAAILDMHDAGTSITQIGQALKRDRTAIARLLRRNGRDPRKGYANNGGSRAGLTYAGPDTPPCCNGYCAECPTPPTCEDWHCDQCDTRDTCPCWQPMAERSQEWRAARAKWDRMYHELPEEPEEATVPIILSRQPSNLARERRRNRERAYSAKRVCAWEGCDRIICNTSTYCASHARAVDAVQRRDRPKKESAASGKRKRVAMGDSIRRCVWPGCDMAISNHNKSGLCRAHAAQKRTEKMAAKPRTERQLHPRQWHMREEVA